ncbi:hypothetical protein A8L34_28040 [Bacillus sp. FJAT-27264]|uniref:hypothetical protein n=1 Tax=Paenibacillus sp. (strain DSM 101736 / FJAT-27264) TaxID=1850362 RepID=UPI000807BEC6|nr:hypothetical protein [Bacillus sp. FJAT-27264]OBZ15900.1 hypothetical protein A8L34_28040 [Bacillus sp. FJAT-27264]
MLSVKECETEIIRHQNEVERLKSELSEHLKDGGAESDKYAMNLVGRIKEMKDWVEKWNLYKEDAIRRNE